MKNDVIIPNAIQIGTIQNGITEDADISPLPSPPSIQSLYTDTTSVRIGQGTNSPLPTRNNKASFISSTRRTQRHQLLLLPKSTELPPNASNDNDDENNDGSNMRYLTKIQQIYGYMQWCVVYMLVNRKKVVLVLNGLHQLWRARFFLAQTYRSLENYPYRQQYQSYRVTTILLGKLAMKLIKKKQRTAFVGGVALQQNRKLTLVTLGLLLRWAYMALMVMWIRLIGLSRLGFKTGYRLLNFFGSWDSLALAFVSVAMTRSLQLPTPSG